MISLSDLTAIFEARKPLIPGKTVKLDFGISGCILFDGKSGDISNENLPADATVSVKLDDFIAISTGKLSGLIAFATGKLRVSGDMETAQRFQELTRPIRPPGMN